MLEFVNLWVLYLLPLPILVYFLLPAAKRAKKAALIAPFFDEVYAATGGHDDEEKASHWVWWLSLIAWIALVISAANPMWVGEPVALPTKGRNIMMAVDLSGSMDKEDFNYKGQWIDRLTATKLVAGAFIEKRKGDRIGLILFGDQAYVQSPLTFDRKTVKRLLDESFIQLAGTNTAIGNAIGLAVKKFSEIKSKQKILILLTDGANTAGEIDPIKAAELAKSDGLKIYTIGIGAATQSTQFGLMRMGSDLDEKTLKKIADITGGKYFRANNLQQLNRIYQLLDQLEPISQEAQYFRPKQSMYYWPLLAGIFFLVLAGLISLKSRR
ncbi:MAG TPA: VWA domain-containing protein [Aeromonadales bacterium]|nr:VWA domain-containing protein [Aeromonadales bacterium]